VITLPMIMSFIHASNSMHRSLALLLALSCALPCHAGVEIPPGYYGPLMIGFDPDSRVITGFYENHTGWNEATQEPRFSCIFFLRGIVTGDAPYPIATWYPSDQPGEIIAGQLNVTKTGEDYFLNIRLNEEHGGCRNVQHFSGEKSADFLLIEQMPWREVRVISAEQAFFHNAPDAQQKSDFQLDKGAAIGVLDSRSGWVYTEEYREDLVIKGWIRPEDLFPGNSGK